VPLFTILPRRCLLGNAAWPRSHRPIGPGLWDVCLESARSQRQKEGQGISTHSLALPLPTRGNVAYQQADVCATGHLVSLSTKPNHCKYYTYLGSVAPNLFSFKGGIIRSKGAAPKFAFDSKLQSLNLNYKRLLGPALRLKLCRITQGVLRYRL
jgi:hypothetical protein